MLKSASMGDAMKKFEAWPSLMNQYLRVTRYRPFGPWGTFDCCMMAADCVQAMTGEDFAVDFRGKYTDAPSAYAALLEFAGGGIYPTMQKLAERFEWTEITEVKKVMRGDIVMGNPEIAVIDPRFDGALGICAGTISIFTGDTKLVGFSTIETPGTKPNVIHAWRIKGGRD